MGIALQDGVGGFHSKVIGGNDFIWSGRHALKDSRFLAGTRKVSHSIFEYIFAARISLKQKPSKPRLFFCRGLRPHWLPHPPCYFPPGSGPSPVALRQ